MLAAALLVAACDGSPKVIDPYPILVDTSAGPLLLAAAANDGQPALVTVDVLSPITVLDSFEPGSPAAVPSRSRVELTLFGLGAGRVPTVPRFRFPDTPTFDLRLCGGDDLCRIGDPSAPVAVRGVIGSDLLSRSSVRFDFSAGTLRFFPDTAGSAADRTDACEAVFDDPFHGGGTLILGGDEIDVSGQRPALRACLDAPDPPADATRGVDAVIALSTGLGKSLLSASAYDRYAAAVGAQARDTLPAAQLLTLSGPLSGQLATVSRYAFVGEADDDSQNRGACRELYANRVLSRDLCSGPDAPVALDDCPCPDDESFCRAGAAIEIERPLEVLVIADDAPILQALRDELRPELAEVDGIFAVDALAPVRLDFDYPNDRMLASCSEDVCSVLPAVRSRGGLEALAACRARDGAIGDAGPSDAGPVDAAPTDAATDAADASDGGPVP